MTEILLSLGAIVVVSLIAFVVGFVDEYKRKTN